MHPSWEHLISLRFSRSIIEIRTRFICGIYLLLMKTILVIYIELTPMLSFNYSFRQHTAVSAQGVGCQLLIATVLQSGVVLISCIDFYVIHLLVGSLKQESILWRILLLLKANLVLMMHEEIFEHWHFSVRFLLKNQLR